MLLALLLEESLLFTAVTAVDIGLDGTPKIWKVRTDSAKTRTTTKSRKRSKLFPLPSQKWDEISVGQICVTLSIRRVPCSLWVLLLAALNPVLSPRGAEEVLRLGDTTLQSSSWGLELDCTCPPLLQVWPLEKFWTIQPLSESCISEEIELWALLLEWLLKQRPKTGRSPQTLRWQNAWGRWFGEYPWLGMAESRGPQCPSKNQFVLSLQVSRARPWSFQASSTHGSRGPLTALTCHS